jgi:Golgi phosphoprotein 3
MMLTIPEEFLLLTIRDDNGGFIDISHDALRAGFVGAAIMELALQNRLDSDLDRIVIVDKTPTGEPCVDLVLEKITSAGFELDAAKLVGQLIRLGSHIRELALDRLVERKILAKAEGRVFWFLKTRRYPVIEGKELAEVKHRLMDVLLNDQLPDPRDVCLISLAEASHILREIVPAVDLPRASKRMSQLSKMDLIGQNVSSYITIYREALLYATTWPV